MKASRSTYNLWAWFLVDGGFWALSMFLGLWIRFQGSIPSAELVYFLRLAPLSTAGLLGSFFYCGVYRRDVGNDWSWRRIWWGWVCAVALSLGLVFFLKIPYSRLAFLSGSILFFGGVVLLRTASLLLYRVFGPVQSVLALGFESDESRETLRQKVDDRCEITVRSVGTEQPTLDTLVDHDADFILVDGSSIPEARLQDFVDFGSRVQVPVRIFPSSEQLFLSQTSKIAWNDTRLLRSELHYRLQQQMAIKTVFDYVLGTVLLLVLSPLFAIISLLVLIVDGRPVLFAQERTGRAGETFDVLKFRTMVPDAQSRGPQLTDGADDPRITILGRWLRRWSLDELPQLWNVLRGEMSLVGPRPEIPSITDDYDTDQQRVLWLKPGLTGLSQVRGRQQLGLEEKLEIDQEYLNDYSIGLDLWILLKTVVAVLRGEGAA